MESSLQVRFWGTRGSGPAPFADRMKYGGNTSCVSVRFDGGLVIFDAGTGLIPLGRRLEEAYRQGEWDQAAPVHIFIGHLHLDHINGLPQFSWLFQKGAAIHIYGFSGGEFSFRQRVKTVCGPPYWPVAIEQVPAALTWHEIGPEETIEISSEARVRTMKAEHPNGGLLFRMESGNQSVVYGLDYELGEVPACGNVRDTENGSGKLSEGIAETGDRKSPVWEQYREFARECGLLIFDAPYTEKEYPAYRGFGHSFWQQGIRMAGECHAARLCISHHDWGRTDGEMEKLERTLKEQAAGLKVEAEFAREGMCIALPARTFRC